MNFFLIIQTTSKFLAFKFLSKKALLSNISVLLKFGLKKLKFFYRVQLGLNYIILCYIIFLRLFFFAHAHFFSQSNNFLFGSPSIVHFLVISTMQFLLAKLNSKQAVKTSTILVLKKLCPFILLSMHYRLRKFMNFKKFKSYTYMWVLYTFRFLLQL